MLMQKIGSCPVLASKQIFGLLDTKITTDWKHKFSLEARTVHELNSQKGSVKRKENLPKPFGKSECI
jgi:hypothetical protein